MSQRPIFCNDCGAPVTPGGLIPVCSDCDERRTRCTCGIAEMSPKEWIGVPRPEGNPHASNCPRSWR